MAENQTNPLQELMQRFAISALSKERKDEAVNEEILVGKYTGEFFIKTKDGVVVSTDILNRLKSSMELAVKTAESVGIVGDVFKIDFDELVLPKHIDYGVNIIESEPIEIPIDSTEILLNLDFDEYDIIGDSIYPIISSGVVDVECLITFTDGSTGNILVNCGLDLINNTIIKLNKEKDVQSIVLNNITINEDVKVYNENAVDRTIILHNIFITINNK